MKNIIGVMLVLLVATPTGLQADVKLTIISDPPGATVYQGQQVAADATTYMGVAPMVLQYKTARRWKECLKTHSIKVRWVSGAEANIDTLSLCPDQTKNQQFVFVRPNVPGVEIDAQYAAAILGAARPVPASEQPYTPKIRMPQTCRTQVIGQQIFTTCTGG